MHIGSGSYDDPSGKIWSLYVSESEKHDRMLAEGWLEFSPFLKAKTNSELPFILFRKSDMDGILIFVCGLSRLYTKINEARLVFSRRALRPSSLKVTNSYRQILLIQRTRYYFNYRTN